MGYYTYYNGEAEFQMEDRYYNFLKFIAKHRFGYLIGLEKGKLTVEEEWKNRGFLIEDLLLFIKKHGKIEELEIIAQGEDFFDQQLFIVEDGELKVYTSDFIEEKKELVTIDNLSEMLQYEYMEKYDISYLTNDVEEDQIMEQLDGLLNHEYEGEKRDEIIKRLYQFVTEGKIELEIDFKEYKYRLLKNCIYKIPFEEKEEGEKMDISYYKGVFLISNYDINKESDVQVIINNEKYPLTKDFMKFLIDVRQGSEVLIVKGNQQIKNVCNVCVNRLKGITNSCELCEPELL